MTHEGFNAWHGMIRDLNGAPDLTEESEDHVAAEVFGDTVVVDALTESKRAAQALVASSVGASTPRPDSPQIDEPLAPTSAPHRRPTPDTPSDRPRTGPTVVGTLAAIFALSIALIGLLDDAAGNRSAPPGFFASLAHVAFIVIALVATLSDRRRVSPNTSSCDIVPEVFRQFHNGWILLWSSWLTLYLFLAIRVWFGQRSGLDALAETITNLIHIVSSYAFLFLFLVLDRPSVPIKDHPDRAADFRQNLGSIQIACGVTAVLSLVGYFDIVPGLRAVGVWTASLLAAISMMYFFMGLGYRELRIQRKKLAPLFLYVALQMLYPVVAEMGSRQHADVLLPAPKVILWAALVLKIHLFFLVRQWIQNGCLVAYLEEVKYPRSTRDLL